MVRCQMLCFQLKSDSSKETTNGMKLSELENGMLMLHVGVEL
jgi:hypothetical protein